MGGGGGGEPISLLVSSWGSVRVFSLSTTPYFFAAQCSNTNDGTLAFCQPFPLPADHPTLTLASRSPKKPSDATKDKLSWLKQVVLRLLLERLPRKQSSEERNREKERRATTKKVHHHRVGFILLVADLTPQALEEGYCLGCSSTICRENKRDKRTSFHLSYSESVLPPPLHVLWFKASFRETKNDHKFQETTNNTKINRLRKFPGSQ